MDDLIFAGYTFYGSELEPVLACRCWLHFFVAMFAEDCVVEYICHVYTCGIYFIKVLVGKVINVFLLIGI